LGCCTFLRLSKAQHAPRTRSRPMSLALPSASLRLTTSVVLLPGPRGRAGREREGRMMIKGRMKGGTCVCVLGALICMDEVSFTPSLPQSLIHSLPHSPVASSLTTSRTRSVLIASFITWPLPIACRIMRRDGGGVWVVVVVVVVGGKRLFFSRSGQAGRKARTHTGTLARSTAAAHDDPIQTTHPTPPSFLPPPPPPPFGAAAAAAVLLETDRRGSRSSDGATGCCGRAPFDACGGAGARAVAAVVGLGRRRATTTRARRMVIVLSHLCGDGESWGWIYDSDRRVLFGSVCGGGLDSSSSTSGSSSLTTTNNSLSRLGI
jgi:hypothetical protein